ncbi:hypothetical protein [Thiobacillus sp.]
MKDLTPAPDPGSAVYLVIVERKRPFSGRYGRDVVSELLRPDTRADKTHPCIKALGGRPRGCERSRTRFKLDIGNVDNGLGHAVSPVVSMKSRVAAPIARRRTGKAPESGRQPADGTRPSAFLNDAVVWQRPPL